MSFRSNLFRLTQYGSQKNIKFSQDVKGHGQDAVTLPRLSAPLQSGTNLQDLKNQLRIVLGHESGHKSYFFKDRENLNAYLVKKTSELPPRTIKDSFLSTVIPLKSDVILQEQYSSAAGDVRYACLVEDIDIFSAMITQKYILNPLVPIFDATPYTVVTVMIDSLIFNFLARPTVDLHISGHIASVGRSSAMVIVWISQKFGELTKNIARAKLLVAVRDANNKVAALINPLQPADVKEHRLIKETKSKRGSPQRSLYDLTTEIPTASEQKVLHEIALRTCEGSLCRVGRLPPGHMWMEDTATTSNVIAFPENRNIHNTLFAGCLLRHAVELAFATNYRFSNQQGKIRGITEMRIYRSIPAGSILLLHAQVAYANDRFVQVAMYADVMNKRDGRQQATNTFHMTIEVLHPVQNVYPKSYREAMLFLDAERRLQAIKKRINEPFPHIDYNLATGLVK